MELWRISHRDSYNVPEIQSAIVGALLDGPMNIIDLSRKINVAAPYTAGNIGRLMAQGEVQHVADKDLSQYELTDTDKISVKSNTQRRTRNARESAATSSRG